MSTKPNSDQIKFQQAGTGAVTRTVESKAQEVLVSPEDFGALGNSTANDSVAVTSALQSGRAVLRAGKTYDLGEATIDITNSLYLRCEPGAKLQNGWLRIRPNDAAKSVKIDGDLVMLSGSLRIAGNATTSWTDPFTADPASITLSCDNISTTGIYPGASGALQLWYLDRSRVGHLLSTSAGTMASNSRAIQLTDIYNSHIASASAIGDWAMGVEFDHSSARPAYAFFCSHIGVLFASKPTSFADYSGYHGIYFHGGYASTIGSVGAIGWGGDISSTADFKWRDCAECTVLTSVNVGRMRFTADNNYAFFTMKNRDNTINNLTCSISLTGVATSPGVHGANTLRNVVAPVLSFDSNAATPRGFIFSGTCSLGVAATGNDITSGGLAFEYADVTFANDPDFIGTALNAKSSVFRPRLSFTPAAASTNTFQDVKIEGNFVHAGGSASHSLDWSSVHVTGVISVASSGVARVTTANWRNVVSDTDEIVDTTFRPDVKKYRWVAFNDITYPLL